MVFDNPSAKIYDCFFRRKPLRRQSSDDLEPIALANAAGTWDHFLFGTESQLRSWFGWMFGLFGTDSLAFDDGGLYRTGLLRRQKHSIQSIYMDFFRSSGRNKDNPAMVRIWGCGPLGESPATKERVLAIQDKRLIGFKVFENNDRGTAPFSLRLMEGRKVKIPAGFLAVPEKKLNRAARFRRWREINGDCLAP